MKATAQDWINTDLQACIKDVARLGLDEAVTYSMDMITERTAGGDPRWHDISKADMRKALAQLAAVRGGKGISPGS